MGAIAGLVAFLIWPAGLSLLGRALIGWNVGVVTFLVLALVWMLRLDADRMHARYREDDPNAFVILLVVTTAALASLVAIVALLATVRHVSPADRIAHVVLAAATVVDSWLLLGTMFTLHYADSYYSASVDSPPLRFPDTPRPVFWDFIYFSFTVAAACQTADVATTQHAIRRVVIAQALISFVFNLAILGFAVNVTAGLL